MYCCGVSGLVLKDMHPYCMYVCVGEYNIENLGLTFSVNIHLHIYLLCGIHIYVHNTDVHYPIKCGDCTHIAIPHSWWICKLSVKIMVEPTFSLVGPHLHLLPCCFQFVNLVSQAHYQTIRWHLGGWILMDFPS